MTPDPEPLDHIMSFWEPEPGIFSSAPPKHWVPLRPIDPEHPEGFWAWGPPAEEPQTGDERAMISEPAGRKSPVAPDYPPIEWDEL